MPGHSAFGKGLPELTIAACGGVLDPTQDATYAMLTDFLTEMGSIFPDRYLALGGDEVSFGCAATVPAIKRWVSVHNMTTDELLPYFWRRMATDVMPKLNRTLYVWATDDLSNLDPSDVPDGTVFNMYTNLGSTLNTTVTRGVPSILSAPFYLDQTQSYRMGTGLADEDPGFPDRMCGTKQHHIDGLWQCFYSAGPDDGVDEPALAQNTSLVLGGEACICSLALSLSVSCLSR